MFICYSTFQTSLRNASHRRLFARLRAIQGAVFVIGLVTSRLLVPLEAPIHAQDYPLWDEDTAVSNAEIVRPQDDRRVIEPSWRSGLARRGQFLETPHAATPSNSQAESPPSRWLTDQPRVASVPSAELTAESSAESSVDEREKGDDTKADDPSDSAAKGTPPDIEYCLPPSVHQGSVPYDPSLFAPDPDYSEWPYLPDVEMGIYNGKYLTPVERPWVELGRGFYLPGRIPQSQTFLGEHNLVAQHFLVYGDYRVGSAYNSNQGRDSLLWAHRLNLDVDWKLTDTERIHAFVGPLDQGASFTRLEYNNGDLEFIDAFDRNWDTVFFEGDVGSLLGGWRGHDSEFDLPFTVGLVPLLFQNGIWMEDAMVGAACSFPAKHSSLLDWSNFDVTFFVGFDELNSAAFGRDDSAANVYGVMNFIEAYGGYLEVGYAYLHDTTRFDRSYHNVGMSFTRRYRHRLSNSVRVIVNSGQDPAEGPRTADGCLVLLENSLITSQPNTFVPYLNLFAGFGRPQSVARAGGSGGVLRNTGILFETDGLTGFPLLDDTASNAFGGAMGVNLLGPDFNYQIVAEVATVQTFGRRAGRGVVDDQYGVGLRYQLPLTHAWLLRLDGMFGVTENDHNLTGARMEMRYKF